jgi:AbiV family abortive infection protein
MDKIKIEDLPKILEFLKKQIHVREFHQISQEECLETYNKVIENANEHLNIGLILADNTKYGSAIVHVIFASKEMTKALVLYVNGKGINLSNVKGFKSFFYRHKPRHFFAHFMLMLYTFMKPLISILQNTKTQNVTQSLINETFDNSKSSIEQAIDNDWWFQADSLKNRGLYVDYSNKLVTPSDFKLDDFKIASKNVIEYIGFCNSLILAIENLSESGLKEIIEMSKEKWFKDLITTIVKESEK